MPTELAAPRLLSAGEVRQTANTHVGYVVCQASIEATYWRPAWPGLTWLFVALAALLLAKRPGQRWPDGRRLAVAANALVMIVLALLLLLPAGVLGRSAQLGLLVGWPVLLGLLLWVSIALAAQTSAGGRDAQGAGCLASLLVVVGLLSRSVGDLALRPEVARRLADVEHVAALIEADAVRLGRWPTPEEWQVRYGSRRTHYGEPFKYTLAEQADHPWQAYTVSCDPVETDWLGGSFYNSAAFGEDGLFATADDDLGSLLEPGLLVGADWRHGRAPRDASIKLPSPTKLGGGQS